MSMARSSTAFGGAGATLLHQRGQDISDRARTREADIYESRLLLLELGLHEPCVTQCFNTLTNFCLSEDIEIKVPFQRMTDEFREFVNQHYNAFASEAIRCFFIYGFVAWYPRKLASGDIVPCVVPHGMYTWSTQVHESEARRIGREGPNKSRTVAEADQGTARRDQPKTQPQTLKPPQPKETSEIKDAPGKTKPNEPTDQELRDRRSGKTLHAGTSDRLPRPAARWDHLEIPEWDAQSKQLRYVVHLANTDLDPDDVFIYEYHAPEHQVSEQSVLHATVPSPMSHILVDYKNLRDAQIRRAYADAWNTTARVFTACQPPPQTSNEPTHSYLYYETGSTRSNLAGGRAHMEGRHTELERQIAQPSNHVPSLYNLPVHHRVEQLHALTPCEDVEFLLEKYRRDVCNLIGVPYEMAFGRISAGSSGANAQADITGRLFTNTVYRICRHIESLLEQAYSIIYGVDRKKVRVILNPMPRLDIRSIEDLKVLWEMGAITPDVVAQLSEVLLVSEKAGTVGKKRETAHEPHVYTKNLENINKAMQPPKPEPAGAPAKKKPKSKKSA